MDFIATLFWIILIVWFAIRTHEIEVHGMHKEKKDKKKRSWKELLTWGLLIFILILFACFILL